MIFSKRPKKPHAKARWVNTRIESIDGRVIQEEGYWYSGPWIKAGAANSRSNNWGLYNDGSESASTLIGSLNTNPAKGDLVNDTIYLFRIAIEEDGGGSLMNFSPQLTYNHNGGGDTEVNATSSVIRSAGSGSGLTDGGDTTDRITSGDFTFDPTNEGQDEINGSAGGNTADLSNTGAEFVWAFTIRDVDVADDDTIVLNVYMSTGGSPLDNYDHTLPTITVEKAVDITVGITTVLATAAVGTVQALFSLLLSTVLATAAVGSVTNSVSVALTGVEATAAVGSVGVTKSGSVGITTVVATSAVDSVSNGTSVALTSAGGAGGGTLDLKIQANVDDGSWDGTTFNTAAVVFGDVFGTDFHSFLWWDNVTIPPGATITLAEVRFTPDASRSGTPVNLDIYMEDVADAVAPTSGAEFDALALTSAVAWSGLPAWVADVPETSDPFTSLVQGIVNKGGWASGQAMQVVVKEDGTSGGRRQAYSGIHADASVLHIEFSAGAAPTGEVGSVDNETEVDLSGEEATSAVGSVSAGGDVEAELTGVEGTSAVGNVSFTESGSVGLTGVAGTSAVDDVAPGTSLPITGEEATSAVGSVDNEANPTLSGEEATGAVGSVDNETEIPLSGEEATSTVGSVSVAGVAGATLSGVGATAAVGNVSFTESGSVGLTGVAGASAEGDTGVSNAQDVTGEEAAAAEGSVSPVPSAPITGEEATGIGGDVGVEVSVPLFGVEGTAAAGNVSFTESGSVGLTGVATTAAVGNVGLADVGQPMTATPLISPAMSATPSIVPVMTATPNLEP
ncbi:MAG: hypothetical protein V3V24_09690 [Nitrospinaceae bacterium]